MKLTTILKKICSNFLIILVLVNLLRTEGKKLNFKLVNNEHQYDRSIAKSSFKKTVIFSDELLGIHFYQSVVKLNKPIFVGITILVLARHFMYETYYEKLGSVFLDCPFPKLYMDTDSFILSVETNDIEKYMINSIFDCSNYPTNHPCFDDIFLQVSVTLAE